MLTIKEKHRLAIERYGTINANLRAENVKLKAVIDNYARQNAYNEADTNAANRRSEVAEQRCAELQLQVCNLLRQFERLVSLQADKQEKR